MASPIPRRKRGKELTSQRFTQNLPGIRSRNPEKLEKLTSANAALAPEHFGAFQCVLSYPNAKVKTKPASGEFYNKKADKWITDSRLLKYEGILLDSPKLTLEVTGLQNPAQFLYEEPDEKELAHNCMTTIEEQTKIRPDLEKEELETGERLFVDG
ncbi:hypothetical protein DUI87_02791 [Hirundo rustica rustica]|uniref:Uncharacterized protein n=1 Tax=Hirundo rustica rustica TaxID=333673 RepID=A0A3M0LG55_HIRRU|nr:hypothetical protein DUI87_02791 [Hirundo rustica rustica]